MSDPSSAKPRAAPRPSSRDRFHGRVRDATPRACEWPGCTLPGEFKAPRSREPERDGYHWYCLEHVRAFNAGYDFFRGMSPDEIVQRQRGHPSWERPTRPFAHQADPARASIDDPMGLFRDLPGFGARFTERVRPDPARPDAPFPQITPREREAFGVLGLEPGATRAAVKRAYKGLVRRYHPDANGGDRSTEPQLRKVIDAYTHLMKSPAVL